MWLDLVHDGAGLSGTAVEVDWVRWAYRGANDIEWPLYIMGGKHWRLLEVKDGGTNGMEWPLHILRKACGTPWKSKNKGL